MGACDHLTTHLNLPDSIITMPDTSLPVIGMQIPWKTVKNVHLRIKHVTKLAQVAANGEVKSANPTMPYALLQVENGTSPTEFQLPITHRVDFLNLWSIYEKRGISADEEVLVAYTPLGGVLGFFLSGIQPSLTFFIYPAGHLANSVNLEVSPSAFLLPLGTAYGADVNIGKDAAHFADAVIIGAAFIAKGFATFDEWYPQMVQQLGDSEKVKLSEIYARSSEVHDTGAAAFAKRDSRNDTRPVLELIEANAAAGNALEPHLVNELVKDKIRAGVTELKETMEAVTADLQKFHPDVTVHQVKAVFIAYNKKKYGPLPPTAEQLARLSEMESQIASIEVNPALQYSVELKAQVREMKEQVIRLRNNRTDGV